MGLFLKKVHLAISKIADIFLWNLYFEKKTVSSPEIFIKIENWWYFLYFKTPIYFEVVPLSWKKIPSLCMKFLILKFPNRVCCSRITILTVSYSSSDACQISNFPSPELIHSVYSDTETGEYATQTLGRRLTRSDGRMWRRQATAAKAQMVIWCNAPCLSASRRENAMLFSHQSMLMRRIDCRGLFTLAVYCIGARKHHFCRKLQSSFDWKWSTRTKTLFCWALT